MRPSAGAGLIARGRIVAADENRSFKTVYRYRCMAWGVPATEWEFVIAEQLPIGLRVELRRDHHGAPMKAYFDGHDRLGVLVTEATQNLEPSRIVAPFDADSPWPGYKEPGERVKAWAVEQAHAMGMTIEFEKSDKGLWSLVAHTERGTIRVPLIPGKTWQDAFESVGMSAYPA